MIGVDLCVVLESAEGRAKEQAALARLGRGGVAAHKGLESLGRGSIFVHVDLI